MKEFKPKFKHALLEPKRNNRFYVQFDEKYDIPEWSVLSINKPKFNFLNNTWEPINIVLNDFISPGVIKPIYKLYNDVKDIDLLNDEDFFNFKIICVDPTGYIIEEWDITVDFIEYINFGDLNMLDDSISNISIKIIPRFCKLINE
jgi:hypothetical protein